MKGGKRFFYRVFDGFGLCIYICVYIGGGIPRAKRGGWFGRLEFRPTEGAR